MKIAVCVASETIPAWQRGAIDALRALDGIALRVVQVDAAPWVPLRGSYAYITGAALQPSTVAIDGTELGDDDIVLDLCGSDPDVATTHGVWSFRIGESDDA
ncbi:MAG TPA: hypothetical protein VE591_00640, partial [Candidatus Acidoferrum sp.]|nr:hypothetical protein [Candidatus Acidoferrum sp.]